MGLSAALALAVASGSACGDFALDLGRDDPLAKSASDRRPQLWTLFDIHRAMSESLPVAPTDSFPYGFPAGAFLVPGADGKATLRIIPAFSEGEPAAYVLPELWVNFDEIWVQPWYFLVTAWNDRSPGQNRLKGPDGMNVPPVWDVGPRSLFYSPFWMIFYAEVPMDTPPDRYTSAQTLFDDNLPIHQGAPWIYSARPEEVTLDAKPVHPYLETPVATFLTQSPTSWVDGEAMGYFNEGGNNFRYHGTTLVVEEVPLFLFARRDVAGQPVLLDAPGVVGSGPLFGRRAADAAGGRPKFGSYTRFHIATVPATAAAFDAAVHSAGAAALAAKMLNPAAYQGRVASNAVQVAETDTPCFEQPAFPLGCTWLDSQLKVEDTLGSANIQRTEVSACSPLVFFGGKGIGR